MTEILWNKYLITIHPNINIKNLWALQDGGYQLGDTILWTPILKAISLQISSKIPVFFETNKLSNIFLDCDFIRILRKRPNFPPSLTNRMGYLSTKIRNDINPYDVMLKIMFGPGADYCPYVDSPKIKYCPKIKKDRKNIAIIHGCLAEEQIEKKKLSSVLLNDIIDLIIKIGLNPLIIANKDDMLHFWNKTKNSNLYLVNSELRDTLSILKQCDAFISNDTGLSHAAQALGLRGIVLFKQTNIYHSSSNRVETIRASEDKMFNKVKLFLNRIKDNKK